VRRNLSLETFARLCWARIAPSVMIERYAESDDGPDQR
jgi:hypothetical protein